MKALVLTGGAARGVYAAGVVEGLLTTETFDIVCGSSVGALNGLGIALDRPELLRGFWGEIAQARVLRLAEPLATLDRLRREARGLRRGSAADRFAAGVRFAAALGGLRALGRLPRLVAAYGQDALRELLAPLCDAAALRRTFVVGVTNLTKTSSSTFYAFAGDPDGERERAYRAAEPNAERLTDANLLDALCASSALPGAFPPVTIALSDGTTAQFADGGIANNSPIAQAIAAGATDVTIILLQHSGLRYRDRVIRSFGDIGFVMHDLVQERILELELAYVRMRNEQFFRGHAAPGQRFIDLRVIGPSIPLRLSALSFNDQASIDRVYNLGVADGNAAQSVRRS